MPRRTRAVALHVERVVERDQLDEGTLAVLRKVARRGQWLVMKREAGLSWRTRILRASCSSLGNGRGPGWCKSISNASRIAARVGCKLPHQSP